MVIENQFGRTDHDHLGMFLTYASVHRAMTGVWIAEQASDDHRQVIDWLNENTPPEVNLYLAELKAFRIGESDPAPEIDVVCRPNMAQKQETSGETAAERELGEWRLKVWEDIHKRIAASRPPFRLQKASASHASTIAVGRSGFSISMLLTPRNQSVGIVLVVNPSTWKDLAYELLEAEKDAIESDLGAPLRWSQLLGKMSARILLEEKLNPQTEANRDAVCTWFATWLPRMHQTFKARVAALDAEGE